MTSQEKEQLSTAKRIPWLLAASRWLILSSGGFLLAGCANAPSMLEPGGPAALRLANFSWFIIGLGTLIYVAVMAFCFFALFRRRSQNASPDPLAAPAGERTRFLVWVGIIGPGVVLIVIFVMSLRLMELLAMPAEAEEIQIHVTGHQWWWEVTYPDAEVVTANEIHIPVGQPVRLQLASVDVIHNFWVPELHGKMDMIPGQTNTFWLQADRAGEYRGMCAEFCGTQHGNMALIVVAEPAKQFAAWLEQQQQPAPVPTEALTQYGQQIFLSSSCVYCHRIAGTNANARVGPDLTHLASRRTLGAGTVENNLGNLAGWILNPHALKPGNLMPAADIPGDELQAMLAYLQTLE